MENSHKIKNVVELISSHEQEIMELKTQKEKAERLLEIFENHIEKCKNINIVRSASNNESMFNTISDIELLNDLPLPMLYLRGWLNGVDIDGGGEAIEKMKELIEK
jgi:hypothetical protein